MALRLKMVVQNVMRAADASGEITYEQVNMTAVYGGEGSANAQWSRWTPSGSLGFQVNNPAAFGQVLPGQFYFVDLVPTDKDAL